MCGFVVKVHTVKTKGGQLKFGSGLASIHLLVQVLPYCGNYHAEVSNVKSLELPEQH